jgi:hypothetical protein
MKETKLTLPEIGQIAFTRIVLGVGIGLLLANKLNADQRRSVGCALLTVGALSTIPIAANVFGKKESVRRVPELEGQRLEAQVQ